MGRGTLAIVLQLVGVGWYVAVCIVGGLLIGLWLDNTLDTIPVFTLGGIVFGTVLAFYGIYKMVLPLITNNSDGEEKGNEER